MSKHIFLSLILVCLYALSVPSVYAEITAKSNVVITKVGNAKDEERPGGATNFQFYCQADPRWEHSINGTACGISSAGCGPTSMAMILSSFGNIITPDKMDSLFVQYGARACDPEAGSDIDQFIRGGWLQGNGFEVNSIALGSGNRGINMQSAISFLNSGYLIIAGAYDFPCPLDGWCSTPKNSDGSVHTISHIFVVDSFDVAKNELHVRDPINCRSDRPTEDPSYMYVNNEMSMSGAWAIKISADRGSSTPTNAY